MQNECGTNTEGKQKENRMNTKCKQNKYTWNTE